MTKKITSLKTDISFVIEHPLKYPTPTQIMSYMKKDADADFTDFADSADIANFADTADTADTADSAGSADFADFADFTDVLMLLTF